MLRFTGTNFDGRQLDAQLTLTACSVVIDTLRHTCKPVASLRGGPLASAMPPAVASAAVAARHNARLCSVVHGSCHCNTFPIHTIPVHVACLMSYQTLVRRICMNVAK